MTADVTLTPRQLRVKTLGAPWRAFKRGLGELREMLCRNGENPIRYALRLVVLGVVVVTGGPLLLVCALGAIALALMIVGLAVGFVYVWIVGIWHGPFGDPGFPRSYMLFGLGLIAWGLFVTAKQDRFAAGLFVAGGVLLGWTVYLL